MSARGRSCTAPPRQQPVEHGQQTRLVRPLGDVPVAQPQGRQTGIRGGADRHRGKKRHRVQDPGLGRQPGEHRGGARREEQRESIVPAANARAVAALSAGAGQASDNTARSTVNTPLAQRAGKIAGDDAAGHVQQPAGLGPQSLGGQQYQVADIAAGAADLREALGAGPAAVVSPTAEQRHAAFRAQPG